MKRQDFIIAGQFVELGQASELTLGPGFFYFEGYRFLFFTPDPD